MTLKKFIPVILLLALISALFLSGCIEELAPDYGKLELKDLKFFTNLTKAFEVSNKTGEPLFVYFRSDTCGWCKKFEEESYTNKSIVGILSNNFTIVSIDVYKQKNITRLYGVRGTPSELFLYANGSEIKRLPGYVDNQTFLNTINEIANLTRGLKNET
ncbi:MAG: thioredoxin fold domain-containing protein [Candidatus Methanoperedens sp.]|nr:thioredoxin fold domain-containing protein [Candidatus Methanoperedens sp.]